MKLRILFFSSFLIFSFLIFSFKAYPLGVGVFIGVPVGISIGVPVSFKHSVDFITGWHIEKWFFIQGTYNFKMKEFAIEGQKLDFYVGAGGYSKIPESLGATGNVGAKLTIKKVEIFAEISPKISLIKSTSFDLSGGIGIRYLL